MVKIGVHSLKL